MELQKAYKLQKNDNISMLPGDPEGSPDESFLYKVFKFEEVINNIQVPDMTRKGNAGLPIFSKTISLIFISLILNTKKSIILYLKKDNIK